jgi:hypothetical protein
MMAYPFPVVEAVEEFLFVVPCALLDGATVDPELGTDLMLMSPFFTFPPCEHGQA